MNERIKHLIEQAQYYANEQNDKHGVSWIRTYNEKFAELIVRECIAQCNDGDSRWFIAQHFGIEE